MLIGIMLRSIKFSPRDHLNIVSIYFMRDIRVLDQ